KVVPEATVRNRRVPRTATIARGLRRKAAVEVGGRQAGTFPPCARGVVTELDILAARPPDRRGARLATGPCDRKYLSIYQAITGDLRTACRTILETRYRLQPPFLHYPGEALPWPRSLHPARGQFFCLQSLSEGR